MKIKNLVRDGNKVMWTRVHEGYMGQVKKIACTTNGNGYGLFLVKYEWELPRYFDSEALDWN